MNETEVKEVTAPAEEPTATPKQYEVGYGKPPKSTQFKPGQSGNPKGRTKGSKNGIYTYIKRELNSSITLTDGSKITKEQGFSRQLTNKALRGDIQSQKLLFNIHQKAQRKDGEQPVQRITDEQYERIQKVIERMRIGFIRQFKEYMDFMTEWSEYATVEWEFKRGDMLTEALKNAFS